MAAIDHLPDEILSGIFTRATEIPLSFHSKIYYLDYEPKMYDMCSHERRMKPATRIVSEVSHR